jgi:pimeloyl-ACP methyl ester carboxylesterase
MLVISIGHCQEALPGRDSILTMPSRFQADEGLSFAARIVAPPGDHRNGYGVLMLGGGYGNDVDWSTPGFVEDRGTKIPLSISGKTHADAPLIATALAEHGFVVMHWGTCEPADAGSDVWPNEAAQYPVKDLLRFSKSALQHFRAQKLFPAENVILLGHSLGAVRAANMADNDDKIAGLILLAAAQLTRTTAADRGRNENRAAANEFIRSVDNDGDGKCRRTEYSQWAAMPSSEGHPLARQSFERLDFFRDGQLVDWEVSAGFARDHRSNSNVGEWPKLDSSGLRWTEDILREHSIDTLVVYGALDSAQSQHAPVFADLIQSERLEHVTLRVLPEVGHQLGAEENGLVGPIRPEGLHIICEWLNSHYSGSESR